MRRLVVALAVVSLAGLSGCSMLAGSSAADGTEYTPGPDRPGWLADDGTVIERLLFQEYTEAANGSIYAVEITVGNRSSSVIVGPNATYVADTAGQAYATGGLELRNGTDGDTVTYRTVRSSVNGAGAFTTSVRIRLRNSQYEAVGTTTVDGRRLYELRLVDAPDATGRALVAPDGRIVSISGERPRTGPYEYDFDWSAETVPRPAWVDRLPQIRATVEGDTLVLENTGGATLPAGTTLDVTADLGPTASGTVALDASLGPGESAALALVENGTGRQFTISRDGFDRPLVALDGASTTLFNESVRVDGRTIALQLQIG